MKQKKSPSPKSFADATDPEFQSELVERVSAVRELGHVPTRTSAAEGKNLFGKELPLFVTAAITAMGGAKESYAGLPFDADSFKRELARWLITGSIKAKVDELAADLNNSYVQQGAALSGKVLRVMQTTDATLSNPAVAEHSKAKTASAAGELSALRAQRNDKKRAARNATAAKKAEDKSKSGEASRLKLENRYLSGERLDPSDLAPQPTAPRGRRRRSRGE